MKTIFEVLAEAKKLGVKCGVSCFWKYCGMGLITGGRKVKGKGNVLYFPANTAERIAAIQCESKVYDRRKWHVVRELVNRSF